VEIAYTVHRVGTPTLVLVHGWMCNQGYWETQIGPLAERFGVVTVDLPGHGSSGRNRANWSIDAFGNDVAAVITHLGLPKVIVAGHSMGGLVAVAAARALPGKVIGVIGVDTLHDAGRRYNPEEVERLLAGLEQAFVPTCTGFVRGMFVPGSDAALMDRITGDMCSGPGEIGVALLRAYVAFDLAGAFAAAGVPIRAINADLWPTNLEGNRALADFDAMILKGYGHFLMQEAPEELARAMVETAAAIATAHAGGPAPPA
jgi:pimeloyl-ACP methyl ester carboxylesterase